MGRLAGNDPWNQRFGMALQPLVREKPGEGLEYGFQSLLRKENAEHVPPLHVAAGKEGGNFPRQQARGRVTPHPGLLSARKSQGAHLRLHGGQSRGCRDPKKENTARKRSSDMATRTRAGQPATARALRDPLHEGVETVARHGTKQSEIRVLG